MSQAGQRKNRMSKHIGSFCAKMSTARFLFEMSSIPYSPSNPHGLEVKKVMSETEDPKKTKTPGHMVYPEVPLGSIGCHSSATGGAGFFEKPRIGNALGSRFHKSAELARNSGNYRDESSPRWWFQSV